MRENRRKCAANKIISRDPSFYSPIADIHHDRDNDPILLILHERSPRTERRGISGKKKITEKSLCFAHFVHTFPLPYIRPTCNNILSLLLPPFSPTPLSPPPLPLLYSSRFRRTSFTGFTSFECRDSITAAKRSMTRRHVGGARITKVDASRVSRVPHRESTNPQSTRETSFFGPSRATAETPKRDHYCVDSRPNRWDRNGEKHQQQLFVN